MKRSEINAALRSADDLAAEHRFALPDFARLTPERLDTDPRRDWLAARQIGWDVTDFGSGEFERRGLTLLCIRNGLYGQAAERPYAEKLLFVGVGQETPFHAHRQKLEDIIVRGGGTLCIEFTRDGAERPASGEPLAEVTWIDGREVPVHGQVHRLTAGQSITVPRGVQHRFWGEAAPVFAAEVSQCNDDRGDNFFLEGLGRFSDIEEDEAPHRRLWNE